MDAKKQVEMQEEHYEPLLQADPHAIPTSTILVAIPANMEAGESVSTKMLRQRSVQGTLMDVEAPATGIPFDAQMGSGAPGQLVFLPDLPSTVQLWHNQRTLMLLWLAASVFSLVLFAPLFMASGLFLAAEMAAVMGVIASVVQLCEKELASTNTLELGAQIKLVATCGTVAFFLDAVTIVLDVLLLLKLNCDPTDDVCTALTNYALGFALFCVQHGVISYMVSQRASKIMPLLNPVTSGLVQL